MYTLDMNPRPLQQQEVRLITLGHAKAHISLILSENAPANSVIRPGTPVKYATGAEASANAARTSVVPITANTDEVIAIIDRNISSSNEVKPTDDANKRELRGVPMTESAVFSFRKGNIVIEQGTVLEYDVATETVVPHTTGFPIGVARSTAASAHLFVDVTLVK